MDGSARPRLADHVIARRHFVDERERVVLHDTREARLVELGPREWGLLAAADGTRDVEGILLAAARDGDAHARAPALVAFLEQLEAAGMLDLGGDQEPVDTDEHASGVDDRRVEPLPGFTLVCDGRGSCCRLYASVMFGPIEAARARSLMPGVAGADRHDRVFTPEKGSAPTAGAAVALTNGRCVFLGSSGSCGLHTLGGARAKPVGCSLFPATFVDDGEVVRISAAVECACVLASVGRADGAPLIDPSVARRSDLDPTIAVTSLPALVRTTRDATAGRADFVAWSRRVAASLRGRLDVPATLAALASSVELDGVHADAPPPNAHATAMLAERLLPWVAALRDRARARAQQDASWRSEQDLARRATVWIEEASSLVLERPAAVVAASSDARAAEEAFYLRAVLHGHQLVGARPVAAALIDRAVRMLVARALDLVFRASPSDDTATTQPLALVEAMMRGHGLEAYASEL